MLELIPFEEGNIIGLRLNGKIEDEEFDETVAKIEEKLKEHKKLRVYAEIEEIGGMSFEAWIKMADKIFPHIEVKHFSTDEKEEAKEWLRKN